jgi:response regulator RpfG family c-di-GMP phosphodiesterase
MSDALSAPSGRKSRVLIVDDEETIRLAFARFLASRGYEVETAASGDAAIAILKPGAFVLMLCDVRMPGLSGLEVVPRALSIDPDLAILMLTAAGDAQTATAALGAGAYDYLVKPVELPDLHDALQRALHKRTLTVAQRRAELIIRQEVAARTAEVEQEKGALRALTVGVAEALINAMEAKDIYLRGHSQRVAELSASIANELGLDVDTIEAVRIAGRLADVGKIGIREAVLNKPAVLTPEEYEHVKDHVRISMEILSPLKHLGTALQFVQDHHEHFDGSGYPRGLRGAEASIGGRIIHAADSFDALTSRRAYREPMTAEETLAYLEAEMALRLDPIVFDALRRVVRRGKTLVFIDDIHG